MANVKKLTKMDCFEMLEEIEEVRANEDLMKFIAHEKDLLSKKRTSGKTATQKENEVIVENIYNELEKVGRAVTITELQAESDYVGQFSNQKVSALMKKLVDTQRVVKTQDKKKSYFSIAD